MVLRRSSNRNRSCKWLDLIVLNIYNDRNKRNVTGNKHVYGNEIPTIIFVHELKNETLHLEFRNTYTFTFDEYDSIKCDIYLWSGKSQEKQSSLSMFVSLALLGKKSARSVARIQCLMFPNTSRYSSGLSFANMLWFSLINKKFILFGRKLDCRRENTACTNIYTKFFTCWSMVTAILKWWCSMVDVE